MQINNKMAQRARIKLASIDINKVNTICSDIKDIADKTGVDWNDAIEGFSLDGRIGHSHLSVPGPDGKFGFGGSCFPKDIQALIKFGEQNNIDMHTLKGAWKTNLAVRPERDWEQLKGRAVSNKGKSE